MRAAKIADKTVPVLLVDDHEIWRGGVRSMLRRTEFQVVGEAGSGAEALEVARQTRPQIVLLDIRMAGSDGFEVLTALKHEHPQAAVIMLTNYEYKHFIARAVSGGASGYLLKDVTREHLLEVLRAVAKGEMVISQQELFHSLAEISIKAEGNERKEKRLTKREVEVLTLVAQGLTNKEIASLLFVTEGTIKSHMEHIIHKLGVSDRVQAAVWATRTGIVAMHRGDS